MIPNLLLSIAKTIIAQFITGYNLIWNFAADANDELGETTIDRAGYTVTDGNLSVAYNKIAPLYSYKGVGPIVPANTPFDITITYRANFTNATHNFLLTLSNDFMVYHRYQQSRKLVVVTPGFTNGDAPALIHNAIPVTNTYYVVRILRDRNNTLLLVVNDQLVSSRAGMGALTINHISIGGSYSRTAFLDNLNGTVDYVRMRTNGHRDLLVVSSTAVSSGGTAASQPTATQCSITGAASYHKHAISYRADFSKKIVVEASVRLSAVTQQVRIGLTTVQRTADPIAIDFDTPHVLISSFTGSGGGIRFNTYPNADQPVVKPYSVGETVAVKIEYDFTTRISNLFIDGNLQASHQDQIDSNPATYQFVQARHLGAGLTITSLRVTNT